MALEAVVFSQDPLTSYNYLREYYNLYEYNTNTASSNFGFSIDSSNNNNSNNYDYYSNNSNTSPSEINHNQNDVVTAQWDHHDQQQYINNNVNSSPEAGHCTMEQYLSGEAAPPLMEGSPVADVGGCGGGSGRRKRRRRSCKNKEEVEQQRMTHIAVERNRRKQMNDYLSVIRSLMPPSYAQRGDQASIVGGAINYVKELQQLCQSLEGHKRTKQEQGHHQSSQDDDDDDVASSKTAALFADFFSFPQYSNRSPATESQSPAASGGGGCSRKSAVGEIEVTMVESHANVKILAKKEGKQLVRLVAGFQGLRLSVLHLNVTTVDSFALYSFSVKIEEGCQLNSVDDIAAAANHILTQIQEDAVTLL